MLEIENIEFTNELVDMCDIEVEDIHCFNVEGIIVHNSKCKNFLEAFKNGEDLHKRMAIAVWGEKDYDKAKRTKIKEVNFGIAYGATPFTFIQRGYSKEEAEKLFEDYAKANPDLILYQKNLVKQLYRNNGNAYTMFGRPRRLRNALASSNKWERSSGEREGLNYQIQGTCADVIRMVLWELYNQIFKFKENFDEVRFAGTVHDEVLYYIRKDKIKKWLPKIKNIMEQKNLGEVPLVVEVELGTSYGTRWTFDPDANSDDWLLRTC